MGRQGILQRLCSTPEFATFLRGAGKNLVQFSVLFGQRLRGLHCGDLRGGVVL
jgi:hypothetical protein